MVHLLDKPVHQIQYSEYAGPKVHATDSNLLDPKKDKARIRAMFVLPEASGKGVGSLILKTAEQAAKEYGFSHATLGATQSGVQFYKAKNWIAIKEDHAVLPDGVTLEVTHIEKQLY